MSRRDTLQDPTFQAIVVKCRVVDTAFAVDLRKFVSDELARNGTGDALSIFNRLVSSGLLDRTLPDVKHLEDVFHVLWAMERDGLVVGTPVRLYSSRPPLVFWDLVKEKP